MVLDTLKGFVPALLATIYVGHLAGVIAGGAAMLGHWRPLFMGFQRGGKIVATTGGAFLGVAPIVGGIGAGIWILVFVTFRYASLASIVGGLSLPLIAVLLGYPWPVIAFAGAAAAAIVDAFEVMLESGNQSIRIVGPAPDGARVPESRPSIEAMRLLDAYLDEIRRADGTGAAK
jgi:acyl-phosphate glycerol 3-phosphate acyltransferase